MRKKQKFLFGERRVIFQESAPAPAEVPAAAAAAPPPAPPEAKRAELKEQLEAAKKLSQPGSNEIDEKLGALADKSKKSRYDYWYAITRQGDYRINADSWDPAHGTEKIEKDFKTMGIPTDDPDFYGGMFVQLKKCGDPEVLKKFGENSPERLMYSNPLGNLDLINRTSSVAGDADFPKFKAAVLKLVEAKKLFVAAAKYRQNGTEKLQNGDSIGIVNDVVNGVKENVKQFKSAISKGDWATAGLYAVAMYALWKGYENLKDLGGDTVKTWLPRIAAAGAIYFLSKKAGFDIGEKLGLKGDFGAELRGSGLSGLHDINIPGVDLKGVSGYTYSRAMFTNVSDLNDAYLEANARVWQFVDPARFGSFKEEFAGLTPAMLDDPTQPVHNNHQLEKYRKVGRELYLIAQAVDGSYNATFRQENVAHGFYKDKSLTEALKAPAGEQESRAETLQNSDLIDYLIAANQYVNLDQGPKEILGKDQFNKMNDRLSKALGSKNLGYYMEIEPNKKGFFHGRIMEYPVVYAIHPDSGDINIFSEQDFADRGGNVPSDLALATVPIEGEGDDAGAIANLRNGVTRKIEEMAGVFSGDGGAGLTLSGHNWDGEKWVAQLEGGDAQSRHLGAGAGRSGEVVIKPGADGRSVSIVKDGSVVVHIQDVLDTHSLHGNLILAALVNQDGSRSNGTDFRLLGFAYRRGMLTFDEGAADDDIFEINVKGYGSAIMIKSVKDGAGAVKYEFVDKSDEARLLQNESFAEAVAEGAAENEELTEAFEALNKQIESLDNNFFEHAFDRSQGWFSGSGVSLADFTGAVPKEFAKALVEAQKGFLRAKVRERMHHSTTFAQAEKAMNGNVLPAAKAAIVQVTKNLATEKDRKDRSGREWSATEFEVDVLDPLNEAGTENAEYAHYKKVFENKVVEKFGKDNLFKGKYETFRQLIEVYTFYTAVCDDPATNKPVGELDKAGKDLRTKQLAYLEYVAKKIMVEKYQERGGWRDSIPPQPGSYWGIKDFDEFVPGHDTAPEFDLVDERERLKLGDEYVEFDQYLTKGATEKKRLQDAGLVILPRKTVTFGQVKGHDVALLSVLLGQKLGSPPPFSLLLSESVMTDVEKRVHERMQVAFSQLENKYGNDFKPDAFEKLKGFFTPAWQVNNLQLEYGFMNNLDTFSIDKQNGGQEDFQKMVSAMETEIKSRNTSRTITLGEQEAIIDRVIQERIVQVVEDNKATFLKDETLKDKSAQWLNDFKQFLFGSSFPALP